MAALAAAAPLTRAFGSQARLPARMNSTRRVVVTASAGKQSVEEAAIKSIAFGSLAGSFLSAGHAQAAVEVANLAASDNRLGILTLLGVPVLGWVGFNILGPLQNQLDSMGDKKRVAAGLGLGLASLLVAQNANAATEMMQLAESDNRFGAIALLFLPVIGWVGFNILQPFLNQLDSMSDKSSGASSGKKRRGVAAGLGLGAASLAAAQSADAATEAMQLAASDNRLSILLLLLVPVVGWVGFNILGPLQNQLDAMGDKKRGVAAGMGLGAASLLAAQSANAATEAMQLAASDNRPSILLLLLVPVVGWVGFNILGPLQNQLDSMKKD